MKHGTTKTLRVGCILLVIFFLLGALAVLPQPVRADKVVATIPVGTYPVSVAVTPNGAYAYVTNEGGDSVSVINTTSNTVTATITVGTEPYDVAITPNGAYAYVTNYVSGTVSVINTTSNTVTANVTVGTYPYGVAVTPNGEYVYVANAGSGTVSVINTATNTVTATIGGFIDPYGVAVTPNGDYAYVANSYYISGWISVINTATNTVTANVTVGSSPGWLAVTPNGAYVYVTVAGSGTVGTGSVSVINTTSNNVTATIPGFSQPSGMAVTPNGDYAYVANLLSGKVSVINTTSNTVTANVTVGTYPYGPAITPSGQFAFVANELSDSVSEILITASARAIYILANGDVSPSTAPIKQNGNNYTLTGNVTGIPDGIIVEKSNITIDGAGYTLNGSGINAGGYGFNLTGVNLVTIKNTIITNFEDGIWLFSSSNNTVSGNNITNNENGIYLDPSSSSNIIYHNDFVNNVRSAYANGLRNVWDNGYPSGGNYWSDYLTQNPSAAENDSSGFWNIPYVIGTNNNDSYPLMGQFHAFTVGTFNGITYQVDVVSNSTTVTGFSFNLTSETIMFTVAGPPGTMGFCRVAIPTSLLSLFGINLADWTVKIDGNSVTPVITVSGGYTYIYFSYTHSTHQVTIKGTSAVPEFQPLYFLPLFMIATLLAALALKRKRNAGTQ